MLASIYRLSSPRDIARVFKRGRFAGDGGIQCKAAPNGQGHSRIVIVVSKKVSKKAVVRNRLRRRISGVIEPIWATVAPGYDIVITVREDILALSVSNMTQIVSTSLRRCQLLITK
jgi:ribonuclease P protein component